MTIKGEEIETTPWHLFYTSEGWVEAGELEVGDSIVSLSGVDGSVDSVIIVDIIQTMYDLTVEEVHTFAVGDGDWVVHNCNDLPNNGTPRYNSLMRLVTRLKNDRAYYNNGNYSAQGMNSSLATLSTAEARFVAEHFIGTNNYRETSSGVLVGNPFETRNGEILRRVYRPPSDKGNSPFSNTGYQANYVTERYYDLYNYDIRGDLVSISTDNWEIISNGHVDISDYSP